MRKPPFNPHEPFGPPLAFALFYLFLWVTLISPYLFPRQTVADWANLTLLTIALLFFIKVQGVRGVSLGLQTPYWPRDLLLGAALGAMLISSLPLLDLLITHSKLGTSELFQGADRRIIIDPPLPLSLASLFIKLIWAPVVHQIFWIGFLLHCKVKQLPTASVLFIGGLLLTMSQLDFSLGVFLLGMISAGMFFLTGAVVSGILIHMSAVGTGILCLHYFPKTITFLTVFL